MAFITFVTTCRGRLAHLRETLPSFVRQPDTEVVVVFHFMADLGAWTSNLPSAKHPVALKSGEQI